MFWTAMILAMATPEQATTPAPNQSLARPGRVTTYPATWVTTGDYPASARREKREGTVEFRVYYGTSGMPNRCEIILSSGHTDLDEMTCRLVRARARFKPGKDERGKATGGYYQNLINWRLPQR